MATIKSIEEKAKAYDEAIEKLRSLHDDYDTVSMLIDIKEELEHIFPTLKESEDERIRKVIINLLKQSTYENCIYEGIKIEDIYTWLEKQGSQILANSCKTCKDEQKPTDKVEQKFHKGEWVVVDDGRIGRIIECTKDFADVGLEFSCLSTNVNNIRLWTIQDAKAGDVLSFNDGHGNDCIELIKSITDKKIEFWFCLTNGNRYEVFDGIIPYTNLVSREDATPATKEQRDILFAKMHEAGYKWDAEKKELKKEEVDNLHNYLYGEQKPAWSEEDEKYWSIVIAEFSKCAGKSVSKDEWMRCNDWLNSLRDRVQPKQEWSEEDENMFLQINNEMEAIKSNSSTIFEKKIAQDKINWLESIKNRYVWKPSDEQMYNLSEAAHYSCAFFDMEILKGLYDDLMKLREGKL